jgi:uncharacterized peroxidase-related enzyme
MAYIPLDENKPGMRSLLAYYPVIARPLTGLMELLMRSDLGLKKGERELIATFVSGLNHCIPCENIHGAVACQLNGYSTDELAEIKNNHLRAPLSNRLKSILNLAARVSQGGNKVSADQIDSLKAQGCNNQEIHDTVLIAALFCMFNRYLDGLGILSHDTPFTLSERSKHIAQHGYSG